MMKALREWMQSLGTARMGPRILAFLIDYSLGLSLVFVATLPLVLGGLIDPVLSFNGNQSCKALPDGPAFRALVNAFTGQATSDLYLVQCDQWRWPGDTLHQAIAISVNRSADGASESRFAFTFALDQAGGLGAFQLRPSLARDMLLLVGPILFSGVTSARGRQSPGKRFAGLRTETAEGDPVSLMRSLARETLKFAPFLLILLAITAVDLTPLAARLPIESGISAGDVVRRTYALGNPYTLIPLVLFAMSSLAILHYWFLASLDRRTGQLDYEALSGTRVAQALRP